MFGFTSSSRRFAAAALVSLYLPLLLGAAPITVAGNQLTEATWDERVKDGLWFVEHFSPFCGHCKKFAPIWEQLVGSTKEMETRGLHLGQVDCIAQGDLCVKLDVKYYPYLRLYSNGKPMEVYDGDRSHEQIQKYLDTKSAEYMSSNPLPPPPPPIAAPNKPQTPGDPSPATPLKQAQVVVGGAAEGRRPNPTTETGKGDSREGGVIEGQDRREAGKVVAGKDGEVVVLNKDNWANYTAEDSKMGPTFIKYYAPWCSHCKQLAPTWNDLAHLLKGTANVAELNCDDGNNKAICQKEGIRGFPTLTFYQEGSKVDYRGGRSLTQMEAFARKAAAASGVRDISPREVQHAIHDDEVFFLLLYNGATAKEQVATVHNAVKSFIGSVIVFKSDSTDLYDRFSIPHGTTSLLVFKDYENQPFDHLSLSPTTEDGTKDRSIDSIKSWVKANKLPIATELTSSIFDDVMKDDYRKLVVVAALSEEKMGKEKAGKLKVDLKGMAKQWKKSSEARGVKMPVEFVWMDADLWGSWISSMYKTLPSSEPTIIISDPLNMDYYDIQANGDPIVWVGTSIFQTLLAIEMGKIKPKSSRNFLESVGHVLEKWNDAFTSFVVNHYFIFGAILVLVLAAVVKLLMEATAPLPERRTGGTNGGFAYRPPATKAD